MKYLHHILVFCFSISLLSCQDDTNQRVAETLKTEKRNDSIFTVISNNWKFNIAPLNEKTKTRTTSWNEWRQFNSELAQKPTGSIGAYKQKTKNLVNKADQLKNNIPPFFDKPQVRSRIDVVITKIKSLYTYLNIDNIPEKKVIAIIAETRNEITSLQDQMEELVRISEIPKEMGEEEMLRALDTTRMANPDIYALP